MPLPPLRLSPATGQRATRRQLQHVRQRITGALALHAKPLGGLYSDVARSAAAPASSRSATGPSCHDVTAASVGLRCSVDHAKSTRGAAANHVLDDTRSSARCSNSRPDICYSAIIFRPRTSYAGVQHHVSHTTIVQRVNHGLRRLRSHIGNQGNLSHIIPSNSPFPHVIVGNGQSLPIAQIGHTTLSTPNHYFFLNNVLVTPNVIKNLISVR